MPNTHATATPTHKPKRSATLYRVETDLGTGPYNSNRRLEPGVPNLVIDYEGSGEHYNGERHPGPFRDNKLRRSYTDANTPLSHYIFGFSSIAQLRKWFYRDETLIWLHQNGFRVSAYCTNDFHKSNCQAMIRADNKKLIDRFDLLDLLENTDSGSI